MQRKTNNLFFYAKIKIRELALEYVIKEFNLPSIKILQTNAGKSVLWEKIIERNPSVKIILHNIDINKYDNSIKADNVKFVKDFDLSNYDIIDCDVYGDPGFLIKTIVENKTFQKNKTVIVYTYCLVYLRHKSKALLDAANLTKIQRKGKFSFDKQKIEIFHNFLYSLGYKQVVEFVGKYLANIYIYGFLKLPK